jgi:DNA-binding LacI/PurR family transcriptional regulator
MKLMPDPLKISTFELQKGEALHRQITRHIRGLIYAGDLPAGSKLLKMHDLAALWNTTFFTIHTALRGLVREGLLEGKPRLGMFIRKKRKDLRSVAIYYGDEILIKHEREFYRALHAQLLQLLHKEKIATRIFIDSRPKNLQGRPLQELLDSISAHEIQGLIVPLSNPSMKSWANKIPVPTSFFSSAQTEYSRICIDNEQIMAMATATLREQGCRTVGLINPTVPSAPSWGKTEEETILNTFLACAEKFSLKTRKSWVRVPKVYQDLQEKFGYNEFHKIWSQSERPEGLIVYPENSSHGVALAILECQVKVPAELKLVLHKNRNVDFLCSISTNFIITSEKDIAEALIQQIKDRFAGNHPRNYVIHQTLVKVGRSKPLDAFNVKNPTQA